MTVATAHAHRRALLAGDTWMRETTCAGGCGATWRRVVGSSGRPRVVCGKPECERARVNARRAELLACDGCTGLFKRTALRRIFDGAIALRLCRDCRKLEDAGGLADA